MEDRLHHRAGRDPGAPRPSLTGLAPIPHHPADLAADTGPLGLHENTTRRSRGNVTTPSKPADRQPNNHKHAHTPLRTLRAHPLTPKPASQAARIGGSRLSEAFCSYLGVSADRVAGPLAPSDSCRALIRQGAKAQGAASHGDRSMSARPRQPPGGEGLRRYRASRGDGEERAHSSAPTEVLIGGWRADVRARALSRQGGVM